MTRPGHNGGPTMESGHAWRKHCWTEARRELLPTLPLEVIRFRVQRARELGLSYRSYASVRAGTNCDIIAFLFSSNALRIFRPAQILPEDRAGKLSALVKCGRLALVHAPIDPARMAADIASAQGIGFDATAHAPKFSCPWNILRAEIQAILADARIPRSGVVMVGDTAAEREWSQAGRLAGYLSADSYFSVEAN